jgi:predicted lipid-binding transport protein (Tim44 family)
MNETASLEIYLPYVFLVVYYVVMFRLWLQPPPSDPLVDDKDGNAAPAAPPSERANFQILTKPRTATARAGAEGGLTAIRDLAAGFDEEAFLQGAARAYEIILTAYAEGNRQVLEGLLETGPLSVFGATIMQRNHKHQTLALCLIGIDEARIVNCLVEGDVVEITVRFVSEMIASTHAEDGTVIEGDPDQIVPMADRWTFRRNIRSSDPNWKLCATRPDHAANTARRAGRTRDALSH